MLELSRSAGDLVSRSLELAERDAEAYDGVFYPLLNWFRKAKRSKRRVGRASRQL